MVGNVCSSLPPGAKALERVFEGKKIVWLRGGLFAKVFTGSVYPHQFEAARNAGYEPFFFMSGELGGEAFQICIFARAGAAGEVKPK